MYQSYNRVLINMCRRRCLVMYQIWVITELKWWSRIPQSVYRLATGLTVRGSNTGGSKIFHTRPDRFWGPPSLLYSGYRLFPGDKWSGARR
jgi:hypothetical protein